MSRKKVSTTMYLEAAQMEALQDLSRRTMVPMSVIVRSGVDLAIEHWKRIAAERAVVGKK